MGGKNSKEKKNEDLKEIGEKQIRKIQILFTILIQLI